MIIQKLLWHMVYPIRVRRLATLIHAASVYAELAAMNKTEFRLFLRGAVSGFLGGPGIFFCINESALVEDATRRAGILE